MGYVPVSTPREQLGHAKQTKRRREALKADAEAKQADVVHYVHVHPHLTLWPLRHVEYFLMALLCLLPLLPDPLLERPLVEEVMRVAGLPDANVTTWTLRFVVFQILLIGGLSWLGAAREDGGRLRVLGFVVALGMPLISLATAMQAAETDTLMVVVEGGAAAPTFWSAVAGKLGIWGLSLFSMSSHLLLWFAAPSVVGGTVEIVQAFKWVGMKRAALIATKQVDANDAQVDRLVDGAVRTAIMTRDRVGTSGLTREDVAADQELSTLITKYHGQLETLCDPIKGGANGQGLNGQGLNGQGHHGQIGDDSSVGSPS